MFLFSIFLLFFWNSIFLVTELLIFFNQVWFLCFVPCQTFFSLQLFFKNYLPFSRWNLSIFYNLIIPCLQPYIKYSIPGWLENATLSIKLSVFLNSIFSFYWYILFFPSSVTYFHNKMEIIITSTLQGSEK